MIRRPVGRVSEIELSPLALGLPSYFLDLRRHPIAANKPEPTRNSAEGSGIMAYVTIGFPPEPKNK